MTLFGHPLHPMTIHFPIVFYLLGATLTALHLWRGHTEHERLAYQVFLVSLAATILSSLVGLIDQSQLAIDDPRRANVNPHITFGVILLIINGLLVYMRFRWRDVLTRYRWRYLGLMTVGVGAVLTTAWLGAELVYRWQVGIIAN